MKNYSVSKLLSTRVALAYIVSTLFAFQSQADLNICPRMPVATAVSNQFVTSISAAGATTLAQPAFSNLSGNITTSQMNSGTGATSSTFWRGDGTWAAPTISLTAPKITIYTSGTGTHTLTGSPLYIRVKAVGGGGGGGGGGDNGTGGAGTNGNNSTFGSSLLTAAGGSGGGAGHSQGGNGGSPTVNSPAVDAGSQIGGTGGGSPYGAAASSFAIGGYGGNGFYGGGGSNDATNNPKNAVANTGGGGAGGYAGSDAASYGGAGGGSGAYVEAIISSPSASYSYAVGAAANGGTLGTNGNAGSNGAAGRIVVEEYYQ